jgi:hypothetical protein
VAIIIICAQFPSTRPVAILLSSNGEISTKREEVRKKRRRRKQIAEVEASLDES